MDIRTEVKKMKEDSPLMAALSLETRNQALAAVAAANPNVVLLPGEGFDAPDWSVRVSLANLPDHAYREIGRDLVTILDKYYSQYKKA